VPRRQRRPVVLRADPAQPLCVPCRLRRHFSPHRYTEANLHELTCMLPSSCLDATETCCLASPTAPAVHARAGVTVQLIAVGLATGDVALHKLYGWGRAGRRSNDTAYAEPLRILSM
jgi:hypothetical protein